MTDPGTDENTLMSEQCDDQTSSDAAGESSGRAVTPLFTVDNITVSFPSTVGLSDMTALKEVLDTQLLGCAVSLDTSSVEVIDTAVLQMLLLFCREADSRGVFTDWEAPSAAVLDAIKLLGLSGVHGLPDAA